MLVGLLPRDRMKLDEAPAPDGEQIEETRGGLQALCHVGARAGPSLSTGARPKAQGDPPSPCRPRRRAAAGRAGPTQPAGLRLTRFGADFLLKRAADQAGIGRAVSANTLPSSPLAALESRQGLP